MGMMGQQGPGYPGRVLLFVLISGSLLGPTLCATRPFCPDNPAVTELSAEQFHSLVLQAPDWWVVAWYHSLCGHCRALSKEFGDAAASASKEVLPIRFGAINCKAFPETAVANGIRYFPTILLYGATKSVPIEFHGWHSASSLLAAARSFVQSNGTELALGPTEHVFFVMKRWAPFLRALAGLTLLLLLVCMYLVIYDVTVRSFVRLILNALSIAPAWLNQHDEDSIE